jgi:5-carboxymethyl-2-hydroxymuconate isomerase
MDRDSNQLRLELAQLVNDQADTAEKRAFTDAELRVFEGRQRQINELCDELHRIAIRAHKEEKVAAEL